MKKTNSFDVLGIGDAIVDIIVQVSDTFLAEHGIRKGSREVITEDTLVLYQKQLSNPLYISGGTTANSIAGIGALGGKACFIGKIGQDSLGKIFRDDMNKFSVCMPTPENIDKETGQCLIFVTDDGERTIKTFHGASSELSSIDIDEFYIQNCKIIYLESTLLERLKTTSALEKTLELAKFYQKPVALNLIDKDLIQAHSKKLHKIIEEHVSIVIANEGEICTFMNEKTTKDIIKKLKDQPQTYVFTRGRKGSTIIHRQSIIDIAPVVFGTVLDTTGAGDMYAAGFIYGVASGYSYEKSGNLGSKMAGKIVTHLGPRPQQALHELRA